MSVLPPPPPPPIMLTLPYKALGTGNEEVKFMRNVQHVVRYLADCPFSIQSSGGANHENKLDESGGNEQAKWNLSPPFAVSICCVQSLNGT